MKRRVALLLITALVISLAAFQVSAEQEENVIYLDDGSYILISVSSVNERATSTKNGSKSYKYYTSDGNLAWEAVLYGTFTYTGTTATCTSSSCSVTISNTVWYVVSKGTSKSGASALGEVTMGRKVLGVTVDKETVSMSLTCDANGNLS